MPTTENAFSHPPRGQGGHGRQLSFDRLPGVAQLRRALPASRLREVNRIIENSAWGSYRTEFYPTYDAREIARSLREQAIKK